MTRRFLSLLLALCLCLAMPLMANGEEAALTVTDMMGREITLEGPASGWWRSPLRTVKSSMPLGRRICWWAAVPIATIRKRCWRYPWWTPARRPTWSRFWPEPDVLIMAAMAQTTEQVEALENAGVKVIVSNAQDIAGTYEAISLIGAICGKDAEAAALVADMQASFQAIARQGRGHRQNGVF